AWGAIERWSRMPSFAPIDDRERAEVMRAMRAAADDRDPPKVESAREVEAVIATAYDRGQPIARAIPGKGEGSRRGLGEARGRRRAICAARSRRPTARRARGRE